jgi:hypothetical protein
LAPLIIITGLSFGAGNEANKLIAHLIYHFSLKHSSPIFAQKEIAELLPPSLPVISIGGEKYLNTYQILSAIKEKAEKMKTGPKTIYPYIFTHPALIPRAKKVALKLDMMPMDDLKIPKMPWPKNDHQWWVRNPYFFYSREIMAYLHFWSKGWI